jgi:hypothetical protein
MENHISSTGNLSEELLNDIYKMSTGCLIDPLMVIPYYVGHLLKKNGDVYEKTDSYVSTFDEAYFETWKNIQRINFAYRIDLNGKLIE